MARLSFCGRRRIVERGEQGDVGRDERLDERRESDLVR